MAHMLKQRFQPQPASLSWVDSSRSGREQIEDIFDQSPSLGRRLPDLMASNYPRARPGGERGPCKALFPSSRRFPSREVLGDDESAGA